MSSLVISFNRPSTSSRLLNKVSLEYGFWPVQKYVQPMLVKSSTINLQYTDPVSGSNGLGPIKLLRNGVALVMDLTICDPGLIAMAWSNKVPKYNMQETNASILSHPHSLSIDVESAEHHPIVVTYNGLMYVKCSRSLQNCGLTFRDIGDICISVAIGSMKIHNQYFRGTYTHKSTWLCTSCTASLLVSMVRMVRLLACASCNKCY